MTLKDRLSDDLAAGRTAVAHGDQTAAPTAATLSLALSEITAAEYRKAHREELADAEVLAMLRKMVNSGRETAEQFSRRAAEESKAQDDLLELANILDDPDHIRDTVTDAEAHGRAAGRYADEAAAERASADLLESYLPKVLDAEATAVKVTEAITATGAEGRSGIGKVMGWLNANTESGTLDKGLASRIARESLN